MKTNYQAHQEILKRHANSIKRLHLISGHITPSWPRDCYSRAQSYMDGSPQLRLKVIPLHDVKSNYSSHYPIMFLVDVGDEQLIVRISDTPRVRADMYGLPYELFGVIDSNRVLTLTNIDQIRVGCISNVLTTIIGGEVCVNSTDHPIAPLRYFNRKLDEPIGMFNGMQFELSDKSEPANIINPRPDFKLRSIRTVTSRVNKIFTDEVYKEAEAMAALMRTADLNSPTMREYYRKYLSLPAPIFSYTMSNHGLVETPQGLFRAENNLDTRVGPNGVITPRNFRVPVLIYEALKKGDLKPMATVITTAGTGYRSVYKIFNIAFRAIEGGFKLEEV